MYNRATPESFLLYKHAILLHKLYNSDNYTPDWVVLNSIQILTSRQTNFMVLPNNRKKVGLHAFANILIIINDRIPLKWLNMSILTYKIYCKKRISDPELISSE